MADAIRWESCSLIGLGRTAVLEPDIPSKILLNPSVPDDSALAVSHMVKGQWFANMIPVKVVGAGLAIEYFYYNMRRLGNGFRSDLDIGIPRVILQGILESFRSGILQTVERIMQSLPGLKGAKTE